MTFDISTIDPGIHTLFVRAMDTEGSWSMVNQKVFLRERFKRISNMSKLNIFLMKSPGYGLAASLPLIPQPDIQNIEQTIDLSGTTPG